MMRFALIVSCAAIIGSPSATADIMTDLANATIVEDFQFGDLVGTSYDAAFNIANPGNLLSTDTTPSDLAGVVTDGLGNLNASLKNNTEFGTTLVDTVDRMSGRVFGVMEMTWDFQSQLDPAENEEIRISLISSGTAGILAEWEVQREDDDTLSMSGNAVGLGSTDVAPVVLNGGSLVQSQKFIGVIEANLDANTYQIHYSTDGGGSFSLLGMGTTDPDRNLDKMRIVLNNDLLRDNVLIDRAYFAFIPEPGSFSLIACGLLAIAAKRRRRGK